MEANFHLFLVLSFVRAVASCLEGTLEPDQILSEPFHEVQGNCSEDSFFQIELIPTDSIPYGTYKFRIIEEASIYPLIELDSSNATSEIVSLSTHSNYFNLSGSESLPFKVHFKEFPFVKNGSISSESGNGTKVGSLGPNHQFTYEVQNSYPGDQFFDLTFNPQSLSSGFLAIRNGNGRISLMSSPTKNPFKVVVSANGTIRVDIVTQNGHFNASNVDYKIGYSVGHEDPTSSTPQPTTTTTPKQLAYAKIFVLEVNPQEFYDQHMNTMQDELRKALIGLACNVTFSESFECRHSCMMSDDPKRSCIAFEASVAFSYFCSVTNDEKLANIIDGLITTWEDNFKVDRIELNDCLSPAQKYWIPVAVGVPLAAMVFVLVGLAIIKSFKAKKKERTSKYSRMMSERNSKVSNGRRSRGNTSRNANGQFEFLD